MRRYSLGHASGVAPAQMRSAGLYGTAVGCMGMLSTVAYVRRFGFGAIVMRVLARETRARCRGRVTSHLPVIS